MRLLLLLLASVFICRAADAPRPNIVVIMSDDMGFSDLGCYGGEIETPVLDSLAAGGVRFTQFYNTARCCPTRASLLSGLYPHQAGMGHMTGGTVTGEGYTGNLNRRCVTIAEVLRPAGYGTYMAGKWHLTRHDGPEGPRHTWPLQRGFDGFYGTIKGGGSFFDPTSLCRGNKFITPENDEEYKPGEFYYTDAISDNAVRFIRQHRERKREAPFFLYVAYTAAHWPMHALPADIAKYRGKYDAGYESVRAARLEKARRLGVIDAAWRMTEPAGDWAKVEDKAWEARCMEVYAAMVDRMDQGIGRIVAELKSGGQFENTLILFLQDNGGCAEGMGRRSNAAEVAKADYKALGPDDLQPQVWPPMQTRDGRAVRTGPGVMPGPADTYIGYGEAWANVSNTPFREYKHWVHEGGISSPLIAHWPAGMPQGGGGIAHEPCHLIDIMATCVDVAGAEYPAEAGGEKITPLEGVSLRPAFTGQPLAAKERAIFWEHEGNRAVREGRWKLVAKGAHGAWELYDMAADRTETANLASAEPGRVKDLAAKWDAWAVRAHALPWPWEKDAQKPGAKTRFDLAAGADLARADAPDIKERAFSVTVELDEPGADGVLVAHGGDAHGWALYFENGTLVFALNRAGSLSTIKSAAPALASARRITAVLDKTGVATLRAGDTTLATGNLAGLAAANPVDGLQVGRDLNGTVGDYAAPFVFTGKIRSVLLELSPR